MIHATSINQLTPDHNKHGVPDPARALAAAIVVQATRDLKSADPLKALDALLWLGGEEARFYTASMSIEADPLDLLISGRLGGSKGKRRPHV